MEVQVTKHAIQRAKERLGIPKRSVQKTAQTAFDEGLRQKDMCGHLKKWACKMALAENHQKSTTIIYGKHLYIFRDSVLITVIHVPRNLHKLLNVSKEVSK